MPDMQGMKRYVFQQKDEVMFRKGRRVSEHKIKAFFSDPEFEFFHDMHVYAIFSHAVYCKIEDVCATDNRIRVHYPSNWKPLAQQPKVPEQDKAYDLEGLYFHVWENQVENKVVIAFRGTRFTQWTDWYANLNFVTRFNPWVRDHYAKVRDLVPLFVEQIHQQMGSDVEIIATGHSLGGGLAQQAAYTSPYINKVYAFAPSPITGYRSVAQNSRQENKKDTRIGRIFEHGEVLAYLRFFLRKVVSLSTSNPEINEVRFNFSQSDAISEHSMGKLAEHIVSQSPNSIYNDNYESIA